MLLGGIGLAKDIGYVLLVAFRRAPVRFRDWSFSLPTPAMTALQYLVGIIDVTLVSSVLYLLLPETAHLAYLPFLAIYLASVLVGILSHVPAGLGVLESMLLLLLPDVPPEQLLASVLMYRVVFEIIPLLVALALWGSFETFAHDGVRLRLMRPRRRPAPNNDA
jgi:phosphatidylglycerol lysyltransferase